MSIVSHFTDVGGAPTATAGDFSSYGVQEMMKLYYGE